jgi:hypothetical protein
MGGNNGTNPNLNYIGSNDNKDLVFRTYSQERVRIASNGEVKINNIAPSIGHAMVMIDSTGTLRSYNAQTWPASRACPSNLPWMLCGNELVAGHYLGSSNAEDVVFKSNSVERMRLTKEGKILMGVNYQNLPATTSDFMLFVEDGIATREVKVLAGPWPDYVFEENYGLMPMNDLRSYINRYKHLPGIPSAKEVEENEGIELGDMQTRLLKLVEEQTLYILQLEESLQELKTRVTVLETERR